MPYGASFDRVMYLQSLLETELSEENAKVSQSPVGNVRKKHHTLTPRQSERNLDLSVPSYGIRKSRKVNRIKLGGIGNYVLYISFLILYISNALGKIDLWKRKVNTLEINKKISRFR